MNEIGTTLSTTDIIAIYAGIVSTLTLIWEIVKWNKETKPDLRLSISKNMQTINIPHYPNNKTYIILTVRNLSSKTTTITNLTAVTYKSLIHFWFNKPERTALFFPNPNLHHPLPKSLGEGAQWQAILDQDKLYEIPKRIRFQVTHTLSEKPEMISLVI